MISVDKNRHDDGWNGGDTPFGASHPPLGYRKTPLSSLVTIVVVTSPIASNPSTELIDRCLASIVRACPGLATCPMVVAADGCLCTSPPPNDDHEANPNHDVTPTNVFSGFLAKQKKTPRQRVFGTAEEDTLARYHDFLNRLDERPWLTVDRPNQAKRTVTKNLHGEIYRHPLSTEWLGFALTLKKAIDTHVKTPLVWVTPHDYELQTEALGQYNADHDDHSITLLERLVQLLLENKVDDNDTAGSSTRNRVNYIGLPNAKTLTFSQRHAKALEGLVPLTIVSPLSQSNSSLQPDILTLEPLGVWKENPHLATVKAYRDFVFGGANRDSHSGQRDENGTSTTIKSCWYPRWQHHKFKRGHFIEDTLGQQMLCALKATTSLEEKSDLFRHCFGTYLLQSDMPCTFHMNGLNYRDKVSLEEIGNGSGGGGGFDGGNHHKLQAQNQAHFSTKEFEVQRAKAATEFVEQMNQEANISSSCAK
jgi:hypothetical protein